MTEDLRRQLNGDIAPDQGLDAPLDTDDARPASGDDAPNPLLREGADAPDAADIEDPDNML